MPTTRSFHAGNAASAFVFLICSTSLWVAERPTVPGDEIDASITSGVQRLVDGMRAQKQTVYPVWPRADHPNEFFVFAGDKRLYSGMFFGHLSMFENATGTTFAPGSHPHLVAIFADKLRSWRDVDAFLAQQNTAFRIPADPDRSPFAGCDVIQYAANGHTDLAIVIIDISDSRTFGQVDQCVVQTLSMAFGYDPGRSKNVLFDMQVLRALYGMNDKERAIDGVAGALTKRLSPN